MIEEPPQESLPKRLLKLDKHFTKKAYKEIVCPPSQSRSKSKSTRKGTIISPSSGNLLPLGLKSKQKRDLLNTEKVNISTTNFYC